jgi:methyl coenzyme M reductase alpha subunit
MAKPVVTCLVKIDEEKLKHAISNAEKLPGQLSTPVNAIINAANSMSAGFRTGIFHDPKTGEKRGDTQPNYAGNVIKGKHGYVGIVYTANYAAQKDNHLHNTLLKAVRR